MKKASPPKLADRFFKWYCRNDLQESILGDLHEQFYMDLKQKGNQRSRLIYWVTVLKFFNRFTRQNSMQKPALFMISNNFRSSLRFLLKHGNYTILNMVGLSIALFSCLLIASFLQHELTFDQLHKNSNQIFRVNVIYSDNSGSQTTFVNSPPALAPQLPELFPEVKKSTQLRYALRASLRNQELVFYEDHGFYADSSFLEIFTVPLIAGDKKNALDEPNSIVITSDLAKKYFGDEDPMGRFITMNNDVLLRVTGISQPIPTNSHLKFDFLISFSTYSIPAGYLSDLSSWSWLGFLTYVQLEDHTSRHEFQAKLDDLFQALDPESESPFTTIVQPLEDIYLGSNGMTDDLASHMRSGSEYTVYALTIVAILILFVASFNLMNLTAATNLTRGKEVGIKKVLGADKKKLAVQLLLESTLITFSSTILAYGLLLLLFPQIKSIVSWDFEINPDLLLTSLPFAFLSALILGILAGIHPSALLANLKASTALKQGLSTRKGSNWFSSGLISLQFIISVSLISTTIVIYKQIDYMRNQSLGFETSQVVSMQLLRRDMGTFYQRLKEDLLQHSQIQSVSRSQRIVGDPWPANGVLVGGESEYKQVLSNQVGYDFLETMGIKLKMGRTFSKEISSDSVGSILINESCVKHLGLENPIGEQVHFFGQSRTIIGVMEDFNFSSLHSEIAPAVAIMPFVNVENLYVKVAPGNLRQSLELIEARWSSITGGAPIEMQLMDDHMNRLYQSEEKLSLLITGFSVLAVFLACLGLYGLIAFTVNKKIKEVGIRKVLGASISSLLILFSKRYISLIAVAAIIASPALYFVLNLWLNEFAYRIVLDLSVLLWAVIFLAVISLATIGARTLRTALANPVNALRNE